MEPFKTMIIMYILTIIFVVYSVLTHLNQIDLSLSILLSILIFFPILAILTYYRNIVRGEISGK